jgi:outer membrane lipoprotein-sorting protein
MKKIVMIVSLCAVIFAQSGEVVAKKAYANISGYKSSISKTTMVLKNAQGDENVRKLEMKKLEGENGDKSLLIFLYPNDLKDTKLLSYEVIGGDDKQWLYLPAIKRVKRISSRNKSGSFMASEFSYEDISSQNYKNYTYPSDAKKVQKNGVEYFEVVRLPKDKHSGYSKQIIYIDTKEYLARFGEFFDKNGRLLKKIYFQDYVKLDGVQRVHKIVIQNVQNNKSSMLTWGSDTINAGLSKRDFSKRVLR